MSEAALSPGQDVVIQKFVEKLARLKHPGLKINDRPDKSNSTTPDIDAVAGIFAIEHTSVDTIVGQRGNNAAFLEILPDKSILNRPCDYWASICLPWDGVENVKNRAAVKADLTAFVENDLPSLDFGRQQITRAGIPFLLHISKRSDLDPRIHIGRLASDDPTLPTRVAELILRKANKLERYKQLGKRTVLLLETEDIALMNQGIMLEAIMAGFKDRSFPACLDELWYADSGIPAELEFFDFTKWIPALTR